MHGGVSIRACTVVYLSGHAQRCTYLYPHQVLELLNHVSRRLKSRPSVLLPVESLLTQFQEPSSPPAAKVNGRMRERERDGGREKEVKGERADEI